MRASLKCGLIFGLAVLAGPTGARGEDAIERWERRACAWMLTQNGRRPGFEFLRPLIEERQTFLLTAAKAAAFSALGDSEQRVFTLPNWRELDLDPTEELDRLITLSEGTAAFRRSLAENDFHPDASPFTSLLNDTANQYVGLMTDRRNAHVERLSQLRRQIPAERIGVVLFPHRLLQTTIADRLLKIEAPHVPVFLMTDRFTSIKSGQLEERATAIYYGGSSLRDRGFRPNSAKFHLFGGAAYGDRNNFIMRFAVNDILEAAFRSPDRRSVEIHFEMDTTLHASPSGYFNSLGNLTREETAAQISQRLKEYVLEITAPENWSRGHRAAIDYTDEVVAIPPHGLERLGYRIVLRTKDGRYVHFVFK